MQLKIPLSGVALISQLALSVRANYSTINLSVKDELQAAKDRGICICGDFRLDKYSLCFIILAIVIILVMIIVISVKKSGK
jgi:t-SNARE complex subunit (syntaxin)